MKMYVDIILSGENFNPSEISERYNTVFRKTAEGYAVISSGDFDFSETSIDYALSEYETLFNAGEKKLGISHKEFWLYVECLQNSFAIDTMQFVKINKFFPKINITYIQEET